VSLLQAIHAVPGAAPALRDAGRSVCYGELAELLRAEIDWLRAGTGERHAVLADNGVSWALADLSLHCAGMLNVPLPHSFTPLQARHAVDDAGIDTLLTDDPARVLAWWPDWHSDGTAPASGLHRLRRNEPLVQPATVPCGTVKVTYTSGSTAAPKGVCLSAASLEAVAASLAGATSSLPITRHLCLLPLATLLENVGGVYAPLLRGAESILPSFRDTGMSYGAFDVRRLLGAVTRAEPHSLILVPELLQALVSGAEAGWPVPTSLQFVAVGGARVSPALLDRAAAVGLPVYEGYGLSECGSVVCLNAPGARRAGTVGMPLPHARVRVDERGEVRVAGATMLGYVGDAPFSIDGEIATGDLGEFDADGFLTLKGRSGNRFITAFGRNVSPEWIESELSQRLGGLPVLAHGEARPYVVALLGAAAEDLSDAGFERALSATNAVLPDYAQVRAWARSPKPFTVADGSLTANGRLRRAAIQARHASLLDQLYSRALAS
jgi:long-subunit acyl-CoA synthetase (AMP-forming)